MNYYEHHLGDYMRDAGHLSMLEDGAYRRLIDTYYGREKPLPLDVRECCKLARANSKQERDAVAYVLREFFVKTDEGYRQKRCDEEIERYLDNEPDREAKRSNERDRQRRTRERRRELFDLLRSNGVVPAYDTPMQELVTLASRFQSPNPVTPVTRDITATHTPDTNHQIQNQKLEPTALVLDADKPPASPPTRVAGIDDARQAKAQRLSVVTQQACDAYNLASFTKRNGGDCPNVALVNEVREKQVKRCLKTASAICQNLYGSPTITPQFWTDYWATVAADDFHSGRLPGGPGHENWKPDFEFLTSSEVMTKLFDRAMSENAA